MTMKSITAAFILVFLTFGGAAAVRGQEMIFPLACVPGKSCFIMGYPDLNGQPGAAQDYACGPSADDGDVFLRLALNDFSAIPLHMSVVAAADGKVEDVKDGIPDRPITLPAELQAGTPKCGNGVVIRHKAGILTAYCHLERNSITVKPGQMVTRGQVIGSAGQSGRALWPQLGFSIRNGGYFVDPITGSSVAEGCGHKPHPLITLPIEFFSYQPAAIVALGFADRNVTAQEMASGDAPRFAVMDRESENLSLWGMALGIRKNDRVEVRIRDPRGRTFLYRDVIADADYARLPVNAGRGHGHIGWRTGRYTGDITITRRVENRDLSVTRRVMMIVE